MEIRTLYTSIIESRRLGRLDSSINVYRCELQARVSSVNLSKEASDAIKRSLELLDKAGEAASKGEIDKGWKYFHCAQRMELFALEPDHELQARVKILREEATSKLRSWRKKAIHELLGTSDKPLDVKDIYTVYMAALIRDEHYSNQAYKGALTKDFNKGLVIILLAVLGVIFALIGNGTIQFAENFDEHSFEAFLSIAVFGLFGAVVSAIIKQMDMTNQSSTIPETITAWRITGLRIFGGAAFAIVIYIFFMAKLINGVFSKDIVDVLKDPTPYAIYAVSFCAGFTERFVLRAVSAVAGKK